MMAMLGFGWIVARGLQLAGFRRRPRCLPAPIPLERSDDA